MIPALVKALLLLVVFGIVLRVIRGLSRLGGAARAGLGRGERDREGRDRPARREGTPRREEGRPAGAESSSSHPPVRREDIIDVPYEDG